MILRKSATVESLQKKSASILDIFTKTVNECKEVNQQISELVTQKNTEIASLQSEVSTLTAISNNNTKIAGKIEALLGE